MTTTVSYPPSPPTALDTGPSEKALAARYQEITGADDLRWPTCYRKLHLLGAGGQGAVYLAQRLGADGFARPVALKVFSPESYRDARSYHEDMVRVGHVAARVARIQHDNVVDVLDFVDQGGIRVMEMEWLDGYDLHQVLAPELLDLTRQRLHPGWPGTRQRPRAATLAS